MLYPLIGARFHGWLDDIVVATYLLGAWLLGLQGPALIAILAGAAVHFLLARLTDYPQGQFKLLKFQTHAYIELAEGIAVLVAAVFLAPGPWDLGRIFVALMGASQFTAFAFSDYRWPLPDPAKV